MASCASVTTSRATIFRSSWDKVLNPAKVTAEGSAPRDAAAAAAPSTAGGVVVGGGTRSAGLSSGYHPDHPGLTLRHQACLESCGVRACASWVRKRLYYAWNIGRLER